MTTTADTTSVFPVLDAPRPVADSEYGRVIFDVFGILEPYTEANDDYSSMPVRLVHDATAGFRIELGPYSLSGADINVLREAVAAYDQTTGRTAEPRKDTSDQLGYPLIDAVKYAQTEVATLIEVAQDRLYGLDVDDADNTAVERIQDLLTSASQTLFEETAPFIDSDDSHRYSDGRPVETHVRLGGTSFTYLAHPDPQHRANRPDVALKAAETALAY